MSQKEKGGPSTPSPKRSVNSVPRPSTTPAVGSSSAGASSPFLERHTSFAIPLSNSYRSRLNELDNANLDRVSSATDNRLFSRQTARTIVVQWWSENDTLPDTIDVHAPHYPHFHPAHSPDLISLYNVDTTPFEIFHPLHDVWKIGTQHTPPQTVDKDRVLQFRNRGVQSGVGMPLGSIMRLGADNRLLGTSSTPAESTPVRNEMPVLPLSFLLPLNPSTPTASTLLSSQGMESPTTSIGFMASNPIRIASTPPPDSVRATTSMFDSPRSTRATEATLQMILDQALPGTLQSRWPFLYTRDMAAGFLLLDAMGGGAPARPKNFLKVFGCVYKNAMYADNRRIWDGACRKGEVDPQAIIADGDKREKKETWKVFRGKWGKSAHT